MASSADSGTRPAEADDGDEIARGWQAVRDAITANYVSDEAWDAIEAFDKLIDTHTAELEDGQRRP